MSTLRRYRRRIIPLCIVCVCVCISIVACYHWGVIVKNNHAINAYNANARQYNTNKHADLDQLIAAQRQVDAQFADVLRISPLLLPSIHHNIEDNAKTSQALSKQLEHDLAQRNGTDTDSATAAQEAKQRKQGTSKTNSSTDKEKINSVLNNNTKLDASMLPSNNQSQNSSTQNTPQPW